MKHSQAKPQPRSVVVSSTHSREVNEKSIWEILLPLTQFSVNLSLLCQALVNFPFYHNGAKQTFRLERVTTRERSVLEVVSYEHRDIKRLISLIVCKSFKLL